MNEEYPVDVVGVPIKVGSRIVYAISRGRSPGLKGPAEVLEINRGHALYRGPSWSFKVRVGQGKPSTIHYSDRIVVLA